MVRIAYCAALAVVVLSVNLNAIEARLLTRALIQTSLIGLGVFAVAATVPFTSLVTERGDMRAIGLRAASVGLVFMAGGLFAWNLIIAAHRL
jgi:hypothetical protein